MSASYPLVRNFSAFSTRFGVSTQPFARRILAELRSSFSDQILHLPILYLASAGTPRRLAARRRHAARPLVRGPREPGRARGSAADVWHRRRGSPSENREELRGRVEAGARATTGSAATRPKPSGARFSNTASRPARQAIALEPDAPEGHFWIAANMGALAESFGLRAGLKYRKPIKEELETVLRLDPAFQQGSADRALGRWYFKVPGLFGGSQQARGAAPARVAEVQPEQHRVALLPRRAAARRRPQERSARASCSTSSTRRSIRTWAPEDQEFKAKARRAARDDA